MAFIRHKQRPITAIAMGGVLVPNRGIGGTLKNDRFLYGPSHWTLTGGAVIVSGQAVLTGVAAISQVITGVADAVKVVVSIDVESITGTITVNYAGALLGTITVIGLNKFSATAGTTNLLEIVSEAAEAIKITRISGRGE